MSAVRGNDANACTLGSPCRNVARALTQVSAGGEVVVLDSGDYVAFTVDKAVTVQAAPGIQAGFTVADGEGIVVNAGSGDVVTLAGLRVLGLGGAFGITFNTGKALSVTHCSVSGFPSAGVYSVGSGSLHVEDSTLSDSGNGLVFSPSTNTATASVNRVRAEGNGFGLSVIRGKATIRDSVAFGNDYGIVVSNTNGAPALAELYVESCAASNNEFGITVTNPNTKLYLSNSTVSDNSGIGIEQQNGSTALSRRNNTIEGNGVNINGTLSTYIAK